MQFSTLLTLELLGIESRIPLSCLQLCDLLSRSPRLKTFKLRASGPLINIDDITRLWEHTPCRLDALEELRVDASEDTVWSILAVVSMPSLKYLDLRVRRNPFGPPPMPAEDVCTLQAHVLNTLNSSLDSLSIEGFVLSYAQTSVMLGHSPNLRHLHIRQCDMDEQTKRLIQERLDELASLMISADVLDIDLLEPILRARAQRGRPVPTIAVNRYYSSLYGLDSISKLANVYFAQGLAKKYPGVTSTAIHPGVVFTEIWGKANAFPKPAIWVLVPIVRALGLTAIEGAKNQLWAASIDKSKITSGEYYEPVGKPGGHTAASKNAKLRGDLYDWTEKAMSKF